MIEDADKKGSTSIDIDFFCNTSIFQNLLCDDPNACIMFKAAPEDIPVYVQQGFVEEGITPRFLIDSNKSDYNTKGKLCFMVSFSQSDGRCAIEKICDHNVSLIEQLFSTIDSDDELSADIDSQTESVIVTSEGT